MFICIAYFHLSLISPTIFGALRAPLFSRVWYTHFSGGATEKKKVRPPPYEDLQDLREIWEGQEG